MDRFLGGVKLQGSEHLANKVHSCMTRFEVSNKRLLSKFARDAFRGHRDDSELRPQCGAAATCFSALIGTGTKTLIELPEDAS